MDNNDKIRDYYGKVCALYTTEIFFGENYLSECILNKMNKGIHKLMEDTGLSTCRMPEKKQDKIRAKYLTMYLDTYEYDKLIEAIRKREEVAEKEYNFWKR